MGTLDEKNLYYDDVGTSITERDFNTRIEEAIQAASGLTVEEEEQVAQEKKEKKAAGIRSEMRKADTGYRTVASSANSLIAMLERARALRQAATVEAEELHQLKDEILGLYRETSGPLLFENLQLVRFDDNYYQYHCVNVAMLNAIVGDLMGLEAEELERLVLIGLVIDLGMQRLPARILQGSGELSAYDKQQVLAHPRYSVEILEKSGIDDEELLDAVLHHHERYNGKGYPDGLSGDEIPLACRITAVCDSFDAAISRKRYRKNKSPFKVLAEFGENTNETMDPHIIKVATTGLSRMLVGRHVVLSDRSVGKVIEVHPHAVAYPVVRVLGRHIQTSQELYPVSLSSYVPLF